MKPAARAGDAHACPHDCHRGGTLEGGSADVVIEGVAAARAGDGATCDGGPTDRIEFGAPGVFVNGRRLARVGDGLRHGGSVTAGASTVLAGDHVAQSAFDPRPADAQLESRFALEQLEGLARKLDRRDFIVWAGMIWGFDLGVAAYDAFRDLLLAGGIANYKLLVVRGGTEKSDGVYDGRSGYLTQVADAAVRAAERSDEGMWHLMEVLVHEFGHHCDYLLRAELRHPVEVHGDAPLEEGDAFVYGMFHLGLVEGRPRCPIATLTRRGRSRVLSLDLSRPHALAAGDPDRRFFDPPHADGREHFSAAGGPPKSGFDGHESIERRALEAAGFSEEEAERIYFGNWLRDFSQFVGGQWFHRELQDHDHTIYPLSSSDLTAIVDVLARMHFKHLRTSSLDACEGEDDMKTPNPTAPVPPDLPGFVPTTLRWVTPTLLGAYHSWEHIDNPTKIGDGRSKDKRLQRPYKPEDSAVDPGLAMKRYIRVARADARDDLPTAFEYAKRQLEIAASLGRNGHGMRHLGQALHTVEDYFAHSNYVEIALTIQKHPKVITWVTAPDPTARLPVVTGTYGNLDVVASFTELIIPKLRELLDPRKAGMSLDEKLALGLSLIEALYGHMSTKSLAEAKMLWEGVIGAMRAASVAKDVAKKLIEGSSIEAKLLIHTMALVDRIIMETTVWVLGVVDVGAAINEVEEAAKHITGDVEPTHTQLGKDDPHHPLHELAARCAEVAAQSIATSVKDAWDGMRPNAGVTITLLEQIFCHPEDASGSEIGRMLLYEISTWANGHAASVEQASDALYVTKILDALKDQLGKRMASIPRNVPKIPKLSSEGGLLGETARMLWRAFMKMIHEFIRELLASEIRM